MKKVWFMIIGFSMMTGVTSALPTEPEPRLDTANFDLADPVSLSEWKTETIQMKIVSKETGRLVYSDQLQGLYREAGHYLLGRLDDGHYQMAAKAGPHENTREFVIRDGELWLPGDGFPGILQPVAQKKGRYLELTIPLAQPRTSYLGMDQSEEGRYRSRRDRDDHILRRIDLRPLLGGRYTLITVVGGRTFYTDFQM